MSKRRIQITDLQKQEIEEKRERRLLIRLHIFYKILLIISEPKMKTNDKTKEK